MMSWERINANMRRMTLPYKDIFTTVYLLEGTHGFLLFDAASFPEDIDDILLPALSEAGVTRENLKYVFISHNHRDHAGGLTRLMEFFPSTCIVSCSEVLKEKLAHCPFLMPREGTLLLDCLRVIPIPGHTADSAALLDIRNNTLITGDCLQLYGIFGSQDWAANINFPAPHIEAIKRLQAMEIDAIYTAHDYHPFHHFALGREAVRAYIQVCLSPIEDMRRLILEHPEADNARIRELYNALDERPTVRVAVVEAVRRMLSQPEN